METSASAVLDVIEAAYRPENGDAAWLEGVARGFNQALGDGSGTIALIAREKDEPSRFEQAVGVDIGPWWREQVVTFEETPRPIYDAFARVGPLLFWSQIYPGLASADQESADFFDRRAQALYGASDDEVLASAREGRATPQSIPPERLALACYDATGRGVGIIVARRRLASGPIPAAEAAIWSRVAAHVAAGHRLRRKASTSIDSAEAVIDGNGRLQHAAGPAVASVAREALRDAAVARDKVRTRRRRRDPGLVTSQWLALVAGRWSLVDSFDRDGRRYVIAHPNSPDARASSSLSERENQIVKCAVLGHSNKLIAYELGLGPSTVAAHLARAAAKLGASTRSDLIRLASERPDLPEED